MRSPLRAALGSLLPLLLVGFLSGCGDAAWTVLISVDGGLETSGSVVFIHIENGPSSGYRQDDETFPGEELVIRDPQTWRQVWSAHRPSTSPPPVDFVREQVLAVFMGQQTLGCAEAAITVESITRQGQELEVVIDEQYPDGGEECQASPYDFVRCARSTGPVSFVRR